MFWLTASEVPFHSQLVSLLFWFVDTPWQEGVEEGGCSFPATGSREPDRAQEEEPRDMI